MTTSIIPKTLPEQDYSLSRLLKWVLSLLILVVVSGCQTQPSFYITPPAMNTNSVSLANVSTNRLTATQAKTDQDSFDFRPGDAVTVSFTGSPSLNTSQQIRTDGKITLPLIGEVQAAGLTVAELQKKLRKLYAPQLVSNQITVEARNFAFSVYVTGAVLRPGKITSDHPLTALDAIMEAGGFDYTTADTKGVVIIRQEGNGTKNYTVNLKRVLEGKNSPSFYLKRGDIIYVPQRFSWF